MHGGKEWFQTNAFHLLALFSVSFCLKMLLAPAYFSTDMDVHQNWLRITGSRPLTEWYFDNESKWTLDYPPLFAYFEWVLSAISRALHPGIASTINQMRMTIYYQRATVILSEIPYLLVLNWIFGGVNGRMVLAYLSLPLILLDNIHFQYNIVMQAILMLSVQLIRTERFVLGAFVYSCLLNFKHIYLYAALAFFVYILKEYVLKEGSLRGRALRLLKIGAATLLPFAIAFLPFVVLGGSRQIGQIISRLFPFQRGLIHEYWAPNFWALYYFADKVAYLLFSRLGMQIVSMREAGELHNLRILPDVAPWMTTIIILLVSVPLVTVILGKRKIRFEWLVFLCGMMFFLFGFHVHQKAITPYIVLLAVFLREEEQSRSLIDCAVLVNVINLLPLLIGPNQKLLRLLAPVLWIVIWQRKREIDSFLQLAIVTVGLAVVFFQEILHPLVFSRTMEFLPLMLNSLSSAAFNISWVAVLYVRQLREEARDGYEPVLEQEQEGSIAKGEGGGR